MIQRESKSGMLKAVIYIVALILLIKLFSIQIVDNSYKLMAKNNVIKKMTVYPSRGLILDRNGKVIVSNDAVYDIDVQYNLLSKYPLDTNKFCELLNVSSEFVSKRLEEIKRMSPNRPAPLIKLVEPSTFAGFQEHLFEFPAVSYTTRTVRAYPYKGAAHVLGYLGEATKEKIDNSNGYYEMGDYVGVTGLESYYEEYLRGEKGFTYQIVDVHGRSQGIYKDGKEDMQPVAGYDIITSLDIDLQTYGEELMQNKLGSIVAIEPSSGEVLAYVSSPAYDPNLLTGRYRGKNYMKLSRNPLKPLINRPISATYPPGSTFKIPSALVIFDHNIHSPDWSYQCRGAYFAKGVRVRCHGVHFLPDVVSALKQSCNSYSCTIFNDMVMSPTLGTPEQAYNKWRNGIMSFGFGHQLGIDMVGEKSGNVPSADYYNRIYGKGRWKANTIISIAIGQGEVLSTPLQLANMVAAVSNDGVYYTPSLIKYITKSKKLYQPVKESHEANVRKEFFPYIKEAMAETVRSGTARGSKSNDFDFAAKTGTAQNPHGKDHSIFIAYAPLDHPKIAVAVIVENGGFGATYAGPISSLMIEKYLNDTISSKRLYLQERMFNANLTPTHEEKN
ncbi:MAG: penicillin-binding protein 2 [Chitinophagales bacterium]|nr:penicillin-binding protein 2 [Chitinophagales bacterium]